MFSWMVWTTPVAVFFSCIAVLLVGMTVWELRSPTTLRRGWLPIATTRGDRLFIGLLLAAYINLAFVGMGGWLQDALSLDAEPSVWISLVVSMAALLLVMKKG
jgi:predicted small integral membrane protein